MADDEYKTKHMNCTETETNKNGYDSPLFKQRTHDAHINQMDQLAVSGPDYSILLLGLINHSPRLQTINYVLILIGTNDLRQDDCSKENLIIGIRALIHRIKTSLPHAYIQISRILNRNDWVDLRVDRANEAIEFVSLGDYLKGIDFEDHVHLNENGYKKFFNILKSLFEEKQIK